MIIFLSYQIVVSSYYVGTAGSRRGG